ncbi:hypothetical protein SEA_FUNSIZED_72 [Mycobacterium phage Funsized]|nr:hypothetical protein SEA_FUNSIZED_72 [Mycobacterium phage Funsized]
MPDDGTFASDMEWADAVDAKVRDAVTHTSTLVEQHRITIPVGATGDNVAVARLHAEAYARARGFEIAPGSFSVIAQNSTSPHTGPGWLGVAFDVVVGKGDIHLDQRVPGVLDRWTWSGPAVAWWRDIFNRADGRQGRVLAAIDENGVRPYVNPRPGDPHRKPGAWNGGPAIRGEGITAPGPVVGSGPLPPWLSDVLDKAPTCPTDEDGHMLPHDCGDQ